MTGALVEESRDRHRFVSFCMTCHEFVTDNGLCFLYDVSCVMTHCVGEESRD